MTAIVGAPAHSQSYGGAFVFARGTGNSWTQQGQLEGMNVSGIIPQLGTSVGLSGDGSVAIVGAPDAIPSGGALIFTRAGSAWKQQGGLLTMASGTGTLPGESVALSADGQTAILGVPNNQGNPAGALVFVQTNGVWTQQGCPLAAPHSGAPIDASHYVTLSRTGDTAVVGGQPDNTADVYVRVGGTWSLKSQITPSDSAGDSAFGTAVALSADGSTLIVGGPTDNNRAGAVWIFSSTAATGPTTTGPTTTGPATKVDVSLSAGGTGTAATPGAGNSVQAGYASLSANSGETPYGIAVFTYRENNVVVSEAGVPASPPTSSARVFVDYRKGVAVSGQPAGSIDIYTGVAIVNAGGAAANVTYTLRGTQGNILVVGHGRIAAGAHLAKFIDQFKDVAPDFDLPANFPVVTQFGSLDITSDQSLSILALRLTVNQRGETLVTSTPIADLTRALSTAPIYFPQFADGGGFITTLLLLNTSSAAESGKLSIFDDSGAPLIVNSSNGTTGSVFNYGIPAGGVFIFQSDGSPSSVKIGSVQLTPDTGMNSPVGAGVFRYSPGGIVVTESGIPAAAPTTHARIYIDKSGGHDTGLAIAAPTGAGLNVTVMAYLSDGRTPIGGGPQQVVLNANGHKAAFVAELIDGLPAGLTGVLDIFSSTPFVALTIRSLTNERGDFLLTTFPIADATRAAPAPILFPQIADGGGYSTQFILLSAGAASSPTLSFFDDSGKPLSIGR
jgi:hypothetical protein